MTALIFLVIAVAIYAVAAILRIHFKAELYEELRELRECVQINNLLLEEYEPGSTRYNYQIEARNVHLKQIDDIKRKLGE